jgi:hypothetical protein
LFIVVFFFWAYQLRSIVVFDFQNDNPPLSTYSFNVYSLPFFALVFFTYSTFKDPFWDATPDKLSPVSMIIVFFLFFFWFQYLLEVSRPTSYSIEPEGPMVQAALSIYAKCCSGCPVDQVCSF